MAHFCINGFKFIELLLYFQIMYHPQVVDMRNYHILKEFFEMIIFVFSAEFYLPDFR